MKRIYLTPLLLIILLTVQAECFSTTDSQAAVADAGRCNGTRISDCLADDEEFLMDSDTNRRILQGRPKTIKFALTGKQSYCNRNSYGSCIGNENKIKKNRPCDYKNTCGRKP